MGKQVEGDRLTRIGGFIGGGGGPALDYNRRTASATEKTAERLATLITKLDPGNGRLNLVWQ